MSDLFPWNEQLTVRSGYQSEAAAITVEYDDGLLEEQPANLQGSKQQWTFQLEMRGEEMLEVEAHLLALMRTINRTTITHPYDRGQLIRVRCERYNVTWPKATWANMSIRFRQVVEVGYGVA